MNYIILTYQTKQSVTICCKKYLKTLNIKIILCIYYFIIINTEG
jgi:hypothetical protein